MKLPAGLEIGSDGCRLAMGDGERDMGAIERITVALPTEMADALRKSVRDGEYASEGEIVRDALHDWARARSIDEDELKRLRQAVKEADDSGPPIPAEQAFQDVRLRIARRQAER